MVASSYPSDFTDWRGRFIYDMAESLAHTEALNLSLWAPPGDLPTGVRSALEAEDAAWLKGMLARGGVAHILRRHPVIGGLRAIGLLRRLKRAYRDSSHLGPSTVAHVNWIQNALPLLGTRLPALITVLGSDLALLRLPGMVRIVRAMLSGRVAILAPNAEWMVPVLHRHFGDLAEIRPIPFGVHERWFAVERSPGAFSSSDWLMVSRVTRAKLGHLFEWGEGLFNQDRKLHLLGPMQEVLALPNWIEYHGPSNPETLAKEWFPKVAGLITLSAHDEGRPQVMVEAMAAGLPIVASDLPAHSELLAGGGRGILVKNRESLASALSAFEDSTVNCRTGTAARSWAAESVGTWDNSARLYVSAYCDLLERN